MLGREVERRDELVAWLRACQLPGSAGAGKGGFTFAPQPEFGGVDDIGYTRAALRARRQLQPGVADNFDLLTPGFKRDVTQSISGQGRASQVSVFYGMKNKAQSKSVYTATLPRSQYTRGKSLPVLKTYESICYKQEDAKYLAESLLAEEAQDPTIGSLKMKWRPFLWRPGDHIHLVSDLAGLDVLAEILEVRLNLTQRSVELKIGNLRGFNEAMGFWVDGSDVCPDGSSLVWAQDGQKEYRRHQSGHWHNIKDQATDTPVGALDWRTSTWI